MNLIRKYILNSGSIKIKAVTKLFNQLLTWWMKLTYNKEITNALPGTATGTIRRKI